MGKMKSKYNSLSEWKKADTKAYNAAYSKGLLDDICTLFGWERTERKKWTEELCIEDAKKYDTKLKWMESSSGYTAAHKNGWLDKCCGHMIVSRKPDGYWTEERCIEDAQNYKKRKEWQNKSVSAYSIAHRNGWLDKCCEHMEDVKRWTKELCIEDAQKFNTKTDWIKNGASYSTAHRNGWLDECCSHMVEIKKINGYWTEERCIEDAQKFNTKTEWRNKSRGAYKSAHRNGWLDKCCEHMVIKTENIIKKQQKEQKAKRHIWTKELCIEDAKKHQFKTDWLKSNEGAYKSAYRNGWLDECCGHMKEKIKPNGYWTEERCIEDAKLYTTVSQWIKNGSSYYPAHRNGWLDKCTKHMKRKSL